MAANGAHELAHIRVPLKVKTTDGAGTGVALVGLGKEDATHERRYLARLKIAEAILLTKIAAIVGKPREANHPDIGNSQLLDLENFHALHSLSDAGIAWTAVNLPLVRLDESFGVEIML